MSRSMGAPIKEKVSLEDEARAMTDEDLARSIEWAGEITSERARNRHAFAVMLSGYPDSPGREEQITARVAAIRTEAQRREAGGARDLEAAAKMRRVLGDLYTD